MLMIYFFKSIMDFLGIQFMNKYSLQSDKFYHRDIKPSNIMLKGG